MKNVLVTMILGTTLSAALPVNAADQTVALNIDKMTCALCPLTVRKAIERVEGVEKVEVDYDSKIAVVTFDDQQTNVAEVAQASTDVGYPATLVND